jgi:hypothetical protein
LYARSWSSNHTTLIIQTKSNQDFIQASTVTPGVSQSCWPGTRFPLLQSKILFSFLFVWLGFQSRSAAYAVGIFGSRKQHTLWPDFPARGLGVFLASNFGSTPGVSVCTSFLLVSLWCRTLGFDILCTF